MGDPTETPNVRDFMAERYEEQTVKVRVGPPIVAHDDGVPLQDWITAHDAWHTPARRQVEFMRDTLTPLFTGHYNGWVPRLGDGPVAEWPEKGSDPNDSCMVVGEHQSKSVRLPVYSVRSVEHQIEARFRYNFHDWKVSVVALDGRRLPDIYTTLISRDRVTKEPVTINACYCEGFSDDWVFHRPNALGEFTVEAYDDYRVWAMCWLLLGGRS